MTSKGNSTSAGGNGTSRKTPLGIERRFDRFGNWLDSSWALKKVRPVIDRYPHAIILVTWLLRILVGGTFAVSGLAKGIDPWGTYYKLQEYLTAMHLPLMEWGNTVLTLCFFLFVFEFFIGVSLITGCFRKATPILAALTMLVMLPLTLWIAIADPVADCGCFGDFLIVSNWATFSKNVILSIGIVWLLKFNGKVSCLITPYLQWIAALGIACYIFIVGLIGYRQQPMIDFRQYKIGSQLLVAEDEPEYVPTYSFVYAKDGVEKSFGEDDELPDEDDGWTFVRREEKEFVKNDISSYSPIAASDFRIWNEDASEDVTESLTGVEKQLMLVTPDISQMSMAESWKINKIYDMADHDGIEFFAVVSGQPEDIEEWLDLTSGQYPIYTAQDTSIKELARGNPALVFLQNGEIVWKSALSAILLNDSEVSNTSDISNTFDNSDTSDFPTNIFETFPIGRGMSGGQALSYLSIILVSFLAFIALSSRLIPIRKNP